MNLRTLVFDIPGHVPSPNAMRLRARMAKKISMRKSAFLLALRAGRLEGIRSFTGPTTVHFEVHRHRLLDDDNLFAEGLNLAGNTARPRRIELEKTGRVCYSYFDRPTKSGRRARVFIVVDRPAW